MADELNAPLGQHKRKRLLNLPVSAPQLLAGALGLSGVVVVAWAALVNDPLGGEPTAVVATKAPPSTQTARDGDRDGKQHARALFGCGIFEERAEYLDRQVARQQLGKDFLLFRLIFVGRSGARLCILFEDRWNDLLPRRNLRNHRFEAREKQRRDVESALVEQRNDLIGNHAQYRLTGADARDLRIISGGAVGALWWSWTWVRDWETVAIGRGHAG